MLTITTATKMMRRMMIGTRKPIRGTRKTKTSVRAMKRMNKRRRR